MSSEDMSSTQIYLSSFELFVSIIQLIIIFIIFLLISKLFSQLRSKSSEKLESIRISDDFRRESTLREFKTRLDLRNSCEDLDQIMETSVELSKQMETKPKSSEESNESKSKTNKAFDSFRSKLSCFRSPEDQLESIEERVEPKPESEVSDGSLESIEQNRYEDQKEEEVIQSFEYKKEITISPNPMDSYVKTRKRSNESKSGDNIFSDIIIKMDSVIDQSFDSMIETIDTMNAQTLQYRYSSDED